MKTSDGGCNTKVNYVRKTMCDVYPWLGDAHPLFLTLSLVSEC